MAKDREIAELRAEGSKESGAMGGGCYQACARSCDRAREITPPPLCCVGYKFCFMHARTTRRRESKYLRNKQPDTSGCFSARLASRAAVQLLRTTIAQPVYRTLVSLIGCSQPEIQSQRPNADLLPLTRPFELPAMLIRTTGWEGLSRNLEVSVAGRIDGMYSTSGAFLELAPSSLSLKSRPSFFLSRRISFFHSFILSFFHSFILGQLMRWRWGWGWGRHACCRLVQSAILAADACVRLFLPRLSFWHGISFMPEFRWSSFGGRLQAPALLSLTGSRPRPFAVVCRLLLSPSAARLPHRLQSENSSAAKRTNDDGSLMVLFFFVFFMRAFSS